MLAYTAVDGLRAISRDFDMDWAPSVNDDLVATRRDWRDSFVGGRRLAAALVALLPLGAGWLR
ncbi:MAG: hypothetical protein QM692_16820 [Thermomicrobiales bacterium]